ncbi:MAG: twin-arginine translocase subunit TatC [Longimicrobiales bacterium]|nr:twin-arginine translocase subunit TatC [Longimicrobiales bacterium]
MTQRRNPRGEMPFLEHLEELRWRIFKGSAALVLGALAGFWLIQRFQVLRLLVEPVSPYLPDGRLIYLSPVDPFFFLLKTSVLLGVILAFPVILYQVWAFLSPALEKREKRLVIPALYGGMVLFAGGVWLGYEIALPVSLRFLNGIQIDFLQASLTANDYLGFVIRLLLAFGAIFELPVVVLILSVLGLVTPAFLRAKRRHAIVIITVVASLLSPGDLIMVTVLMMVPLVLLYELGILLSVLVYRRREAPVLEPDGDPPDGVVEAQ